MKKLNLKIQDLVNPTVLSRQQLKNVMGGSGSASSGTCNITLTASSGVVTTLHPTFQGYVTCQGQLSYCEQECARDQILVGGTCSYECSAC